MAESSSPFGKRDVTSLEERRVIAVDRRHLRALHGCGPRRRAWGLLALLVLLEQVPACTTTPDTAETGREILDRARSIAETSRHWTDRSQKIHMEIFEADGRRRVRDLTSHEKRDPTGGRRSILFFSAPAEFEGLGLLAVTRRDEPGELKLYVPGIDRVREVRASARGEPFVGSDLTFRDLDLLQALPTWTAEEAEARLVGETTIEGEVCHHIELSPRSEDVEYGRIVLWLTKDDLTLRRILLQRVEGNAVPRDELEDGDDKRIELGRIEQAGSIPVAHRIEVETLGAGSRTIIERSDVKFDQGLEDDLFSEKALERGRR